MAIAATIAVDLVARTEKFASAMKDTTAKLKDVGTDISDLGKTLSTRLTLPLVGAGAAAFKMASDAAESSAKMEAVFGSATANMNEWISELRDTVPQTTAEIQGMASQIQDLLVPLGLAPDAAFDMTQQVVQLSADLASFNNLPTADVLQNIQSAMVGQTEGMLKYGVAINAATIEQKALTMGLIEEGEVLDAASRAQASFQLILEGTTAAHGDAARTAGSSANQMKFLWAETKEAAAVFGTQLLPVITPIIERMTSLVRAVQSLNPETQRLIMIVGGLAAVIGPVLLVTGKLMTTFADMVTALPKVASAFQTMQTIVSGNVIPAFVKLNAVLLANPLLLVVAGLTALAAAFVYVYQRSETFRALTESMVRPIIDLATAIREGLGGALTWIGNAFSNVFGAVLNGISSFVSGTLNFLGNLLPAGVRESLANFGSSMTSGVREAVDTAKQIISELRGPSLDLGVTGSNSAARDALYGPVIAASTEAGEAITEAAQAYTDSLIQGAQLNTLNASEVRELITLQAEYREKLAQGNLTLQERNQITQDLNQITQATSSALAVNTGELMTSVTAMGMYNQATKLQTIELGEATATMANLSQRVGKTSGAMGEIASAGLGQIGNFLGQFSPMSLAMEALGEVFKVLQPVIDALKEPFKIIAQIIGRALIPILQAFWPIIRGLVISFSYVAEIFFKVAGGIASAVGGAIAAIGGVIAKIPLLGGVGRSIQERGQAIANIGAGFTQAGKDMKLLREEIRAMDFTTIGQEEQTNALLTEGNKEQARVAANTQRMADAIEEGAMKPNMTINVTVQGGEDGRMTGQSVAQAVLEEIDRRLGENTLRDSRFDGMMMAL